MAGFQFGRGLGKRIAEIAEYYAVENDAERIGFVAQLRWCGCEHTPTNFALLELDYLQLLAAGAFACQPLATAVRAERGRFDGVRDAMGMCK